VHVTRAKKFGILVGVLMLTAACSPQAAVQEPVSSGGIATEPQPAAASLSTRAGAAAAPTSSAINEQPAPKPPAIAVQVEQPAITVQAEVGYAVGNRIPDFALTLADGSTFTSQDIISQGRPVFLFFTASW